ncbi:hypothetical protein [Streptomyces sp. NPDC048565]|uniref:hypothetical protein n=1 Tax=Streptomyces sp. NPDC048565 TaxID=3155266 RepID=UPI003445E0D8
MAHVQVAAAPVAEPLPTPAAALPVTDLDLALALALAQALAGLDGGVAHELLQRQLERVHRLAVVRLAQRHAR